MTNRYSSGAILLHWLIAICIIAAVLIAEITDDWEGPSRGLAMMWHKSLGISVLALTFIRIFWRVTNRPPQMDSRLKKWEVGLSHTVHFLFYFMMLALPLSGWLMSSAPLERHPLTYFGLFDIPYLPVLGNKALGGAAHETHEILGNVMIAAFFLHVAGALKHQLFDKYPSLSRMGIGRR